MPEDVGRNRSGGQGLVTGGRGVRVETVPGEPARRRGEGVDDPLAQAIEHTQGLRAVESTTITRLELTTQGTRGAAADGQLFVAVDRTDEDEQGVVLVQEEDRYSWAIPKDGADRVALPIEPLPGSRGFLPKVVHRVVRLLAVKTAGWAVQKATNTFVGAWDDRRHPYGLRSWTAENHRLVNAAPPDWRSMGGDPALLVIHGFTGSIHDSFGALPPNVVAAINQAYRGRTFAFDHPTLAVSPAANAEKLRELLLASGVPLQLDILAHSRGGLVARELAQRLAGRDIRVRSITFVATPNAGTPLADPSRPTGLLDALTNLIGAVPGSDVVEMVLELLKDVVLESALEGLPGLTDMGPGSSYLAGLNALATPPNLMVRAIAADFEPRCDAGIVQTAHNRALDTYFGGLRNDRIVPTLSTIVTGGAFSVPAAQRLVLDSSRSVDHSSFWTDVRATRQLTDWLRPDWTTRPPAAVPSHESEPAAEIALQPDPMRIDDVVRAVVNLPGKARRAVEGLIGGPLTDGASPPSGHRPAVVVVPGIMGTHLGRENGELIWVDPLRLRRGHFAELRLPAKAGTAIGPAGLHNTYLPLISHLAATFDVYLAPYDWRDDIRTSAKSLARLLTEDVFPGDTTRPVHIVAHSMGGLVARTMAVVAPEVWAEMGSPERGDESHRSGRLVMMGTPNKGSFATVLTLLGSEMILRALAAFDVRSNPGEVTDVVATFPGLYQLLPAPGGAPDDDQHRELYDVGIWMGTRLSRDLLADAEAFHAELGEVRDPDRLVYVAGYGHPTPFRLEIRNGLFTIGQFRRGDGRVALALGELEGVRTYFCRAHHGGIPSDPQVLGAIAELLSTGTSKLLPDQEPERRGDDALERPAMIPAEDFDARAGGDRGGGDELGSSRGGPPLDEALRMTLGGGAARSGQVRLVISILHASLEQASHPVAVGHYARLPPDGAERFLDSKLDGALRARQHMGQYPDEAGRAIFVPVPEDHRPRGGLVLGLGEFGTLTTATLTEAMAQAVIARALDDRQRRPADELPAPCGISSVLVGTPGRHGLSVESSVVALCEGVLQGVARLQTLDPPINLETVELEFVELYEQRAEQAAVLLSRITELLEPSLLNRVEVVAPTRLMQSDGAQPGAPDPGASGTPWIRVMVTLEDDGEPSAGAAPSPIRTMQFSSLGRAAQSNLIKCPIDLRKVQDYIAAAVRRADTDHTVSRTLYEMLFPVRAKLDLDRSESLHLLVDPAMAEIPWELLAAASVSGEVLPIALRAGMLRQLHTTDHTRERSLLPSGNHALVVGDPPTALPRLHGARLEARQVAELLQGRDWTVQQVIFENEDTGDADEWTRVFDALIGHRYRVVHIAAHGIFDEADHRASGVVIGPKSHHRLTSMDFEKMTATPELVFLNCCHLGRIDALSQELTATGRRAYEQPHRMAASVAQQLLRNGVRAVVVAGWAVDDAAALTFADKLYSAMLNGYPFGESVRRARVAAHEADNGSTNTWGAYQCYGDPDFLLAAEEPKTSRIVSAAQVAKGLELAAIRAGSSTSKAHLEEVAAHVQTLRVAGAALLEDAAVLQALGHVYGELGLYADAVSAYEQALTQETGSVELRAVEQLANLTGRYASQLARQSDSAPSDALMQFEKAAERLRTLEVLAGMTSERYALRGALEKRRAAAFDDAERKKALHRACAAYRKAWELSSAGGTLPLNAYHTNLWLQTSALGKDKRGLDKEEAKWLDRLYGQVGLDRTGYWEIAAIADTLLTATIVGRKLDGRLVSAEDAETHYRRAFDLRSTVRQRESAIDHLEDLSRLLGDDLGKELRAITKRLAKVGP